MPNLLSSRLPLWVRITGRLVALLFLVLALGSAVEALGGLHGEPWVEPAARAAVLFAGAVLLAKSVGGRKEVSLDGGRLRVRGALSESFVELRDVEEVTVGRSFFTNVGNRTAVLRLTLRSGERRSVLFERPSGVMDDEIESTVRRHATAARRALPAARRRGMNVTPR